MADAEGPGVHAVKECSTLSFTDLGGVEGFQDPGESQVYGLKLVPEGYYIRAPIALALPEPDWDVKLELNRSQVFLKNDGSLTHLDNAGKMLVSFSPHGKGAMRLTTANNPGSFYFISPKDNANTNIAIKAVADFSKDLDYLTKPPDGSTIYIESVLADTSKKWVELLPGLSIKWDAPTIEGFVITNPGGKVTVRSTNSAVETKLGERIGLQWFYVEPKVGFLRLFVIKTPVSDTYLQYLTNNVKTLLASI